MFEEYLVQVPGREQKHEHRYKKSNVIWLWNLKTAV
jgi:hypothetical protein